MFLASYIEPFIPQDKLKLIDNQLNFNRAFSLIEKKKKLTYYRYSLDAITNIIVIIYILG